MGEFDVSIAGAPTVAGWTLPARNRERTPILRVPISPPPDSLWRQAQVGHSGDRHTVTFQQDSDIAEISCDTPDIAETLSWFKSYLEKANKRASKLRDEEAAMNTQAERWWAENH